MTILIAVPASAAGEQLEAIPERSVQAPNADPTRQPSQAAELFANVAILAIVLAAPALMCVRAACANDFDMWWHLRTGEWILQHHAIPHFDLYSRTQAGQPWQPYSWLFELILTKLFLRLGLVGIVAYSSAMVLAITVAMRHMIQRLQADFTAGILLTFVACFSLGHLFTPRPWMFTILFFVLEIDILMHARKTGKLCELAWLPAIFALWSNLHIQFIDGLLVLALAVAESWLTRWGFGEETRLPRGPILAAFLAGVLATLANPFGWHIYRVAHDLATQTGVMNKIQELQAIPFRDLSNYALLFLALAAAGALARSRRFRVFEVGSFLFAVVVSFRSQRDVWVMATVAAAILASTIPNRDRKLIRLPWFASAAAILAAAALVAGGFKVIHVNQAKLEKQVAETFPVAAVEAIRTRGYSGPVFNDFNWGGYLLWTLRMPVSLDGRAAFYGDQNIDRSIATWNGEPDWASDPQLKSTGMIVGPVKAALTQLLRTDPNFQVVYEDKVAAVFIRRK